MMEKGLRIISSTLAFMESLEMYRPRDLNGNISLAYTVLS